VIRRRTIAIGDIHGCSAALSAVLRLVCPLPGDRIVTLGDYIDRGPDSRGVIEHLLDLERRGCLVPLLGNHEQMMLDSWARRDVEPRSNPTLRAWLEFGGMSTIDSYGPSALLDDVPDEHIAFLRRCLPYYETETHLFIHANFQPDVSLDHQTSLMLRWESLRDFEPSPHRSGKVAIVGHTSQKTGEILDLGHLKCIDTYCHGGGWLTALDVDSGQLWQVDRFGRPRPTCDASSLP
jgi:Calcineurin-like phosphoesterase